MSAMARAIALFSGSSVIGSITQVAKGKIMALFLGASGVGVMSQLTTMWSLVSVLSGLGFYNGMTRHLAQHWRAREYDAFRAQLSSSAVLLFGTSLTVSIGGVAAAAFISDLVFGDAGARADLIRLVMLATPFFVMSQVYRAMLNATRSVSWLVRARIFADVMSVGAMALFLWLFGLAGAVMGFIALHFLFLCATIWVAKRAVRVVPTLPELGKFEADQVRKNIPFGVNGLVVVSIGLVPTLIISFWIINDISAAANGLFAMALKVGTVYLGALSTAAGGYYFPTLASAQNADEFDGCINETLKLYLFIIAPSAVFLMAGGDILMAVLFTREFIPAAALLLLMLPADIFRITTENLRLAMVVKKRLVLSSVIYLAWAVLYVTLALYWLRDFGIMGAALAYLISHIASFVVMMVVARLALSYRMSRDCKAALLIAIGLVGSAAAILGMSSNRWVEYGLCTILLMAWLTLSLRDPYISKLAGKVLRKLKPGRDGAAG